MESAGACRLNKLLGNDQSSSPVPKVSRESQTSSKWYCSVPKPAVLVPNTSDQRFVSPAWRGSHKDTKSYPFYVEFGSLTTWTTAGVAVRVPPPPPAFFVGSGFGSWFRVPDSSWFRVPGFGFRGSVAPTCLATRVSPRVGLLPHSTA